MPETDNSSNVDHLKTQEISDGCPDWAQRLIQRIYILEVEAGHIANPKADQWSTKTQEQLLRISDRLEATVGEETEQEIQALFLRVCRGLAGEGFSPEKTAEFINERIPTGNKLKYCNMLEVSESLAD